MDATLNQIRELIAKSKNGEAFTFDEEARLVSLVDSLDRWMSQGETIPKAWRPF